MKNYLFTKNTTSSARARARGPGPDRSKLPLFKKINNIPTDIIKELNLFFENNRHINDLKETKDYKISNHCPLNSLVPEGFQHVLITKCRDGADFRIEKNYTLWSDEVKKLNFYHWFTSCFPNAFRVRLSLLEPGTEFSWHIDTNTSVACRCSASLNISEAKFEIRNKKEIQSVPFEKPGDLFFTNTGWSHRVYNPGQQARLNLVFGIEFSEIERWF